ncbi:uncharacterized protein BXZ73DRAFT_72831 [Epithele typhae]|uniref:uncharacterized protein n=1 Tax=Epithele typhae TaxID=378194 RepID=UPI002007F9B5|nr:uncharacterized protein BXZ73DRAFT_72831 [Epithele typhae]KAH9945944.1 hypothetical protein BXZ73DRAFT_72831 [Epithele typhae]
MSTYTYAPPATRHRSRKGKEVDRPEAHWPSNATNMRHTVDLRRGWVPSPELHAQVLPRPSSPAAAPIVAEESRATNTRTFPTTTTIPARSARSARAYDGDYPEQEERHTGPHHPQAQRHTLGNDIPHTRRSASTAASTTSRTQTGSIEREKQEERSKSWFIALLTRRKRKRTSATSGDTGGRDSVAESWGSAAHRDRAHEVEEPAPAPEPLPEITPTQWRAYGVWARPLLGPPWNMVVHNATPPRHARSLSPPQVDAMLASLRDADGSPHPERWVARVAHPALPPRPALWPTPRQSFDAAPGALQLNPFLLHPRAGPPPLHFDLRGALDGVLFGAPLASPYDDPREEAEGERPRAADAFWCDGPNGAQPATFPGVPRLRITALADDPAPPPFPGRSRSSPGTPACPCACATCSRPSSRTSPSACTPTSGRRWGPRAVRPSGGRTG